MLLSTTRKGTGLGVPKFVAQNLLGVEEIDALILSGLTAEGKSVKVVFKMALAFSLFSAP